MQSELKFFTSRQSIAQYEFLTRPGTSSNFSRTYRKTQLLRKLDCKQKLTSAGGILQNPPLLTPTLMMCKAQRTPLHNYKERKFILAEKGKSCQRKQAACQTDYAPDANNLIFIGPNLFKSQETTTHTMRPRTYSMKRAAVKTQPSFSRRGSVDRFKSSAMEHDIDLVDYVKQQALRQIISDHE